MADAPPPPPGRPRAPGMDHAHYPFRPLPDAPRFAWPDGAKIAFTVTLHLDVWELDAPADASADPRIVSPLGKFFPDWLTWSHREYGARVGIFRVLDVLDQFGVRPSVALGAAAALRYPELVDECLARGACFMAAGTYATRRITSRMTEAEERAHIAESHAAITAATGRPPRGWAGQDFNESVRTPALLAGSGFAYVADWSNDDRPYRLGPYDERFLVSLPAQAEWDDLETMALRRVTPPVWADGLAEAFAVLHEEGGACFNLGLHPAVAGQAHRIRWLREALARMLGAGAVWRATTDEVVDKAVYQLS